MYCGCPKGTFWDLRNAGRLSGASGTGGILVFSRGIGVFFPRLNLLDSFRPRNGLGCGSGFGAPGLKPTHCGLNLIAPYLRSFHKGRTSAFADTFQSTSIALLNMI